MNPYWVLAFVVTPAAVVLIAYLGVLHFERRLDKDETRTRRVGRIVIEELSNPYFLLALVVMPVVVIVITRVGVYLHERDLDRDHRRRPNSGVVPKLRCKGTGTCREMVRAFL